jgi:hypothetical protein
MERVKHPLTVPRAADIPPESSSLDRFAAYLKIKTSSST